MRWDPPRHLRHDLVDQGPGRARDGRLHKVPELGPRVHRGGPLVWQHLPCQDRQQRRLAHTVPPHDAHALARVDLEVHCSVYAYTRMCHYNLLPILSSKDALKLYRESVHGD